MEDVGNSDQEVLHSFVGWAPWKVKSHSVIIAFWQPSQLKVADNELFAECKTLYIIHVQARAAIDEPFQCNVCISCPHIH